MSFVRIGSVSFGLDLVSFRLDSVSFGIGLVSLGSVMFFFHRIGDIKVASHRLPGKRTNTRFYRKFTKRKKT